MLPLSDFFEASPRKKAYVLVQDQRLAQHSKGQKYGLDFGTKNPSTISILLDIDVPHFCTLIFFCFSMFFDVFRMSAQSFWCSTVARVKACFVACSKHVFSHRSGGSFWRKLQAEFRSTSTSATSFRVPSGRWHVLIYFDLCFPLPKRSSLLLQTR